MGPIRSPHGRRFRKLTHTPYPHPAGGRAVREEQIVDAVWPEAEGDMAIQSMSVALRRLRQLLGHEESVQRQEGVLSLDARYCWVDAFAFERILGKAASPGETGRGDGAAELEEKALALYRGPFLAEDAGRSWAVSMRERLRSRFLSTVGRLGARLQQEGQWEKARVCYQVRKQPGWSSQPRKVAVE